MVILSNDSKRLKAFGYFFLIFDILRTITVLPQELCVFLQVNFHSHQTKQM